MATTKEIRISQLPLEKNISGLSTIGVNSANQSVRVPLGEVINDEIRKVKRTYNYSRIDALTEMSSSEDVASALIPQDEIKRAMPTVGDILVDWSGVTRVPVVRQSVKTGGEKPIYSFSYRTADNTATKTVTIQGYLYEPQTVVGVETVKDVTQQQISTLDTQLADEATARLNQDDVLEAKITDEKNARIAKDDVIFTVTKDTINDAETVGDAKWVWALTPSVSDEELNTRIAKRANFYVDVSIDILGFLPYLKYIKLESVPENTDGVFSALIPPAQEFGYMETTSIKVKYNAKHKRWIALFYGAESIIPTATDKKNGLMSKSDKATLDALPTQLAEEQTARTDADKVLTDNLAKEVADRTKAITALDGKIATETSNRTSADTALGKRIDAEQTAREQADTAINTDIQGIKDKGSLYDFFIGLGAEYDNLTNSYTYCDNTGLSLNDLIQAYYCTYNWWNVSNAKGFGSGPAKCIFRPKEHTNTYYNVYNFLQAFNGLGVKIIDLSATSKVDEAFKVIRVSSFDYTFQDSTKIEEIRTVFDVSECKTIRMSKALAKCKLLLFKKVKTDVDVKDLPSLNKKSVLFMIQNATPPSAIIITLHPTAYAMATADPEIQAELEKQPNISLAEGTPSV